MCVCAGEIASVFAAAVELESESMGMFARVHIPADSAHTHKRICEHLPCVCVRARVCVNV
jgi:hypothetical protein